MKPFSALKAGVMEQATLQPITGDKDSQADNITGSSTDHDYWQVSG